VIKLTNLDGTAFWMNPQQITVVSTDVDYTGVETTDRTYHCKETPEQVIQLINMARREWLAPKLSSN
jgi:uncharacterized protein YlzI (FlbEa/FlbD family)